MKRLSFLGGSAALAAGALVPAPARAAAARRLAPVMVELGNVTRTTVGLRPYRASGFVVRAEGADRQTIVHNYGHGGGGMSLSWGTALQARALALATGKRRAAVIGCGVIGLSTARVLQDAGFSVVVYARELPPLTTSNVSGAQWSPTGVFDFSRAGASFVAQFVEASEFAQRRFQTYLGTDYGVRWIENYDCRDDPANAFLTSSVHPAIRHLYPGIVVCGAGSHPFAAPYVTRFLTMIIEPNTYLRALMRDVQVRGGTIVVRDFANVGQVRALDEELVVNCSGLGAKTLFGDAELEPVRGQLSVLAPQPDVDYIVLSRAGYMFPRSDGIVLGGTYQHGSDDTTPDRATEERIVDGHRRFFAAMRA